LKKIKIFIGTGFYSGFTPVAPGTAGSIVAFFIFLIPGFENLYIISFAIIFSILIGIPLGNFFENIYGKDPGIFTLDEFIGTWIAFLFVPKHWLILIIGFLLWRILDILKPFPANKAEKLTGGVGIVLDDIISGVYSLIIIHIFITLFNFS